MCLIVFGYRVHADFPLVVAANRDEYYERGTEPAHLWENFVENGSSAVVDAVFAGKDLQEGGMWMGVTKSGKFAAVTNYREAGKDSSEKKKSRGSLVAGFFTSSASALEYLKQVSAEASLYLGFSLVIGDNSGMYCFSNRGDQQHPANTVRELAPGHVYCLCNRLIDDPWRKVRKAKHDLSELLPNLGNIAEDERIEMLQAILKDTGKAALDELPTKETGYSEEIEEFLSSIFIESQSYGTRACSTVIMSAPNHAKQQDAGGVCSFTEYSYGKGGDYSGKVSETFGVSSLPGGSGSFAASTDRSECAQQT